jgi:hypothetical protein
VKGRCYFAQFDDPAGSQCDGPLKKTNGSQPYCEKHYENAMIRADWWRKDNDARKMNTGGRFMQPGEKTHQNVTQSGGDR